MSSCATMSSLRAIVLTVMIILLTGSASPCAAQGDGRAVELSVWNDPAFRRRFAESYASETEIEPRVTADELKQMQRVLDLIAANELDKAADHIRRRRNEASTAVYDFTLGNIHFQRDELAEAATAYEAAVAKFPKFRRAWRNLGLVRAKQDDLRGALPSFSRVVELGGGDSTMYGLIGFATSSLGDEVAAENAYRMAIMLDPATFDWKIGLARSLFKQRRFADAAALVEMLIVQFPDRGELWLLQANAQLGMNEPMRAAQNYEIVDAMGQSTVESLATLGDIYVNAELFDLAVARYVRALGLSVPLSMERAMRAAKVMAARGAANETAALLEAVESVHGAQLGEDERKELLRLRARIAVARGEGEQEAALLEEIVALDPLDGDALILLGRHHADRDDPERAIFYYERASGVERHEAEALRRHAQLLVRLSRIEEALPLLRRSLEIDPRENVQQYYDQLERMTRGR